MGPINIQAALESLRALGGGWTRPSRPSAPLDDGQWDTLPTPQRAGDIRLPPMGGFPPAMPNESEISSIMGAPLPNRFTGGEYGSPDVYGKMSVSGGGQLNNRSEAALSGLKGLEASRSGGFRPGPAELFRLASRAPETVAPGSNQYWGRQLQEQQANEDFATKLQQAQQGSIQGGIAGQHPAVQAAAEAEARRKAYPSMEAGRAQLEAARVGAAGRMATGESYTAGRQAQSHAAVVNMALRGLMSAPPQGVRQEEWTARWMAVLDAARRGKFSPEDLGGDIADVEDQESLDNQGF